MRAVVLAQPTRRKRAEPSPAWRLYVGSQQQLVRAGLEAVWERYGFRQLIDAVILSPRHGPLEAEAVIAPYDFTWRERPRPEVAALVRRERMVERLQALVAGRDLVLVLLSKTYLQPLGLPEWVPGTAPQRWLFFTSGEGLPYVPRASNARLIRAGMPEARRKGVKALDLKAHLFRKLCLRVAEIGPSALEEVWRAAEPLQ